MKFFLHTRWIAALLLACFVILPVQAIFAEPMSSGAYSIQSDSMNFEGARSSSASYALEDTGGEVGTGYSSSGTFGLHAGYQQQAGNASSTSTSTPPTEEEETPSRSSPGGSVVYGSSINVIGFTATPLQSSILLSWNYPQTHDIAALRIVRSTSFFPSNVTDGEIIFDSGYSADLKQVIDNDVIAGTLYYYTLFAVDSRGNYSSGALASARIAPGAPVVTSTDPFADVPMATDIDPAFKALTLLDFDFIQDGIKIVHAGTTVVIDGSKNLTISLDYHKVPELLKTIAITLADPDDSGKVFTFLLRANDDRTAYEAIIAPLGKGGKYELRAIILDYKNQGLTRLEGMLRASVFDAADLLDINTQSGIWFWSLLIVILAVLVYLAFRHRTQAIVCLLLTCAVAGSIGAFAVFGGFDISTVQAAINKQINYQGKLADGSGDPVADGTYAMEFKLYTVASGGSEIWTETLTGGNEVTITDGLFSVLLGAVSSLDTINFNQTLYLGVNIEGDGEMTPRKKLGAVPAAFVADTLDNLSSEQFLRSDAQNATSSSSTFLNILQTGAGKVAEFFGTASRSVLSILSNGNVGIGTTTPTSSLAVEGTSSLGNTATAGYFVATTSVASIFPYASSTALTVSGNIFLGSLTGPLQALNGLVSATSTLSPVYGGTGLTSYAEGDILYGTAGGSLAALPRSANGLVLKLIAGLPSWQSDLTSGGGGGASAWATSSNSLIIYPADTSQVVVIGSNATTSLGTIFEIFGSSKIGSTNDIATISHILATGSSTLQRFTFTNATGTNATTSSFYSSVAAVGTLSVDSSINGPLHANAGVVAATSSVGVVYGGTGLTSAPSYGNLLVGNAAGGYTLTATTSLGITSSQWTTNGSNIYYNTGNVSIGTTTSPSNAFTVLSTTQPQMRLAYDTSNYFTSSVNSTGGAAFSFAGASSSLMLGFAQPAAQTTQNGLSATTSLYVMGAMGGNSSFVDTFTLGGTGGPISLSAGQGGTVAHNGTLSQNTQGGTGGATSMTGGQGGFSWSQLALGGIGGNVTITGGVGGNASTTSSGVGSASGGPGGVLYLLGGSGGSALGGSSNTQGFGGSVFLGGGSGVITGTVYIGYDGSSTVSDLNIANGKAVLKSATGNLGLGTTSPYAKLSVVGEVVGAYFTATTTTASTFPYASSTAITVAGTASTTNLIVSNSANLAAATIGSLSGLLYGTTGSVGTIATSSLGLLTTNVNEGSNLYYTDTRVNSFIHSSSTIPKTYTNNIFTGSQAVLGNFSISTSFNGPLQANVGLVSATSSVGVVYGGTGLTSAPSYGNLLVGNAAGGYTLTATSSLGLSTFSYPFTSNATSTLLSFTGGLTSYASTTIGDSTQIGGLTISGGATTTGTAYFAGNVGIATTSPWRALSVKGSSDLGDNALAGYFTATTTTASVFPTASTTNLSIAGKLYDSTGTAGTNGQVLLTSGSASVWTATSSLGIALSDTTGTLSVSRGGTGQTTFGQGWLGINDSGAFISSTSPTVNYITATSTTATSTFAGGIVGPGSFTVQSSSGWVGIGTTNPGAALGIAGDIMFTNSANRVISIASTSGPTAGRMLSLKGGGASNSGGDISISGGNSAGTGGNAYIYGGTGESFNGNTYIGFDGTNSVGSVGVGGAVSTGNILSVTGQSYFSGNVGVGTTSPYAKLSVDGRGVFNQDVRANYFTATSTTVASVFPAASTTALTISKLYDTSGSLGTNGMVLQTNGSVSTWVATSTLGLDGVTSITAGSGLSGGTITTSGTIALDLTSANVWTGLQQFSNASTSQLSVYGPAYFGATATSSFSSTGVLTLASALAVTSGGTGLNSFNQGDILFASAANTLSALAKDTNATRYLSNTGSSNNPAWAQIDLSNGVTSDLPFSNLTQGSALSVLGVTGNATADLASIAAGSDFQVLRRSGTSVAFGSIDLSQSAAVTNALTVTNGGTGAVTFGQGWIYSNGGTGALAASTSPTINYLTATSTATSTFAGSIAVTETNATSTFAGGIDLSNGCFAMNGACLSGGSGSGTVNSGTTNTLAYYTGATAVSSATFLSVDATNSRLGIGTSTPYSKLSLWGSGTGSNRLFEVTNNASTTLHSILENGTAYFLGNVGIGTTSPYAALSVVGASGIVADIYTATSTTATSTFAGGVNAGAGNLLYDLSTGITSAASFQTGNLHFDTDAGAVSWADLPLSSAANGTIQSYTAFLNASSTISVYGIAAASGWLQNDWPRVSIGQSSAGVTTPTSKLTVFGNGTGTGGLFELMDLASTTRLKVLDNGNIGVASSSPFGLFSLEQGTETNSLFVSNTGSTTPSLVVKGVNGNGNVGIATSSPWTSLGVNGTVAFSGLNTNTGNAVCISTGKEITDAGGTTCTPSSARFKENISTLSPGLALDTLSQLQVVDFDYKEKQEFETNHSYGMIAEDVEKIDKNLVDYGYDGKPLSLHFEKITGLLVQAVQEQQGQIGTLASSTFSLNIKDLELSTNTASAFSAINMLNTNLASTSQTTKTLASALDLTNDAVTDLATRFDLLTATTSDMALRLTSLESQFSTLTASSTLIALIASSTADLITAAVASSTVETLASSTPFLERIFGSFVEMLSGAVTKIKGVFVGELHVENKLCVDDVCINKDQLKALLVNAGGISASSTPSRAENPPVQTVQETQPPISYPIPTTPEVPIVPVSSPETPTSTPETVAVPVVESSDIQVTVTEQVPATPPPAPESAPEPAPETPQAPSAEPTAASAAPAETATQ